MIRCKRCDAANPAGRSVCRYCGCALEKQPRVQGPAQAHGMPRVEPCTVWMIRCPVEQTDKAVGGPDASCASCPYRDNPRYAARYDLGRCKPRLVELTDVFPASLTGPALALEELDCRLCQAGEDILARPAQDGVYKKIARPVLLRGGAVIGSDAGRCTVRPGFAPDFFTADEYLEPEHCRIRLEGGAWYVEPCAAPRGRRPNPTCVNGVRLTPMIRSRLRQGDLLQLADRLFLVQVRGG